MDDLISRAATLERMKSMASCATCDNYNYVRCRACSWDDAMNIVEEMSEVDAVSVEWLQSKRKEALHEGMRPEEVEAVEMVLWMWQKEQEAR